MHRRTIISNLERERYDNCVGPLYAMNAVLPIEYRVKISSIEYDKLTRQDIYVKCSSCDKEIAFKSVQVCTALLPLFADLVNGKPSQKIWICTECKAENKLHKTEMFQKVLQEPYFLKVVPKPPLRKDGVQTRMTYDKKARQWVLNFFVELEERLAQFRDDSWKKGDSLYEETQDIDTRDEVND